MAFIFNICMQIHIRGGYVIPVQVPGFTTAASRQNPFALLVSLSDQSTTNGDLYIDDGESLDNSK